MLRAREIRTDLHDDWDDDDVCHQVNHGIGRISGIWMLFEGDDDDEMR